MQDTDSDTLLAEQQRLEAAALAASEASDKRKHDRFMAVLRTIGRTVTLLGAITVTSIFGGPYALQGCQYASDRYAESTRAAAEEERAAAFALVQGQEAQAVTAAISKRQHAEQVAREAAARRAEESRKDAERQAREAGRRAAVESCVKSLGLSVCEEVQNVALLEAWGPDLTAESIGANVDKMLYDRSVVTRNRADSLKILFPKATVNVAVNVKK